MFWIPLALAIGVPTGIALYQEIRDFKMPEIKLPEIKIPESLAKIPAQISSAISKWTPEEISKGIAGAIPKITVAMPSITMPSIKLPEMVIPSLSGLIPKLPEIEISQIMPTIPAIPEAKEDYMKYIPMAIGLAILGYSVMSK